MTGVGRGQSRRRYAVTSRAGPSRGREAASAAGPGRAAACGVRGGTARGSAPGQLRCPAPLERPRRGAATAAGTAGVTQRFAVPAGGGGGDAGARCLSSCGRGTARAPRGRGQQGELRAAAGKPSLPAVTAVFSPAAPRLGTSACIGAAAHRGRCRAVSDAGPVPAPRRPSGGGMAGTVNGPGCFRAARRKGRFVATRSFGHVEEGAAPQSAEPRCLRGPRPPASQRVTDIPARPSR